MRPRRRRPQAVGEFRALFSGPDGERLLALAAVIVTTQMSWGMLVPVLPAYAQELGVGAVAVGLVITMFGVGRVAANIPAGMLGRKVDRVWLLIGGSAGVVLFSALSGFALDLATLLVLRLLTGIAGGFSITAGQTLLADAINPRSRARALSFVQAMQLVSSAVGPALGGFVAELAGLSAPFFISGLLCLIAIVWVVARQRVRRSLASIAVQAPGEAETDNTRGRSFVAAYTAGFAVFFARFGVQQTLIPLVAYNVVGFAVWQLGTAFALMSVLNIVCAVAFGGLSDRVGRRPVIVWTMVSAAVATAALSLPLNAAEFVVVLLLFGIATSLGGPVPIAYVSDIVSGPRRSGIIGIYRTFGDVAGMIGPVMVGGLVALAGVPVAAAAAAFVGCGAAAVFGWGAERGKR